MQSFSRLVRRSVLPLLCSFTVIVCWCLGASMIDDPPATYFAGAAREVAQAIDDGDLARLRSAAQGLEIDARGSKNMTLLWYAIKGRHYDSVRELVALGSKVDANGARPLGTPLFHALVHDPRLLQSMLDGGLSPDYRNDDGTALLQRAMISNQAMEQVKLLVGRGANVNSRNDIGATAFYEALMVNKPDIALYLLEQGARFDTSLTNGVTPAWAVYTTLRDLQPGAARGTVTDIGMVNGVPVTRDQTPPPLDGKDEATHTLRAGFERLRDLMVAQGEKWPPDPPDKVREQMKAQGLKVAE